MSPNPQEDLRRRTTRACDQCRKTKSRCEHPGKSDDPCRNCLLSGIDCTFLEPTHKRGPPKGYLSALEHRLHDAEALLGAIISSNDPRATTLVTDLSKDSLANIIITRIANSSFGPIGRSAIQNRDSNANSRRRSVDVHQQEAIDQEVPSIDNNGHLVFTTPNNTWQDYLNLRLATESRSRQAKPPVRDATSELPSQSNPLPKRPPSLDTTTPPRNDSKDPMGMNVDSYDDSDDGAPSHSSHRMAISRGSADSGSSDSASSPSTRRSHPALAVDVGGTEDPVEERNNLSYLNLAHSLGLDNTSLTTMGSSFSVHHFTRSPLDASNSPVPKRPESSQADPWERLVVAGGSPSPPGPFNRD